MKIEVNGEPRDVPSPINIKGLIEHLALAPERLAIELNRKVVRRADWQQTNLEEGDRLEIVHFVGGGEESRRKAEGSKQKAKGSERF